MQKIISTERLPIKMWLDAPEEGAIKHAKNPANLPFAFKHICLMPDTHEGYGMPIGGVLATHAVIIPNAVGVDIGCGMCAVKTNIPAKRWLFIVKGRHRQRLEKPVLFRVHREQNPTLWKVWEIPKVL